MCNLCFSPLVGLLSDSAGRLPFRLCSALASVLWPLCCLTLKTNRSYTFVCIVCFGLLASGSVAIRGASAALRIVGGTVKCASLNSLCQYCQLIVRLLGLMVALSNVLGTPTLTQP